MEVHGNNIQQKKAGGGKYRDTISQKYLEQIERNYRKWKHENLSIVGPVRNPSRGDAAIITKRVSVLNTYKNFLDKQVFAEHFDSRSNLHSSVLEEFMYYLFKDLVNEYSESALIGKSHTFKDIFFMPPNFTEMLQAPHVLVETKDHDFAIGTQINAKMKSTAGRENFDFVWDLPAIAIECKTYLDKTMLQDASTAAEQLKMKNPNAFYIVVAEWLKLTSSVNLKKYKIDQIYILRKQKNTDREFRFLAGYKKNPIYSDVVFHLFNSVRTFLSADWEGGIQFGLNKGHLL